MAIRSAAKGTNVLLVLDDVWDPKHEKPLNCIDPDNASRLLVTTRMRGLLRNCAEVDVDAEKERMRRDEWLATKQQRPWNTSCSKMLLPVRAFGLCKQQHLFVYDSM